MDSLDLKFQEKLVEQLRRRNDLMLAEIIERKLKEEGIVLSKMQFFRLHKMVKKGDLSEIKFRKINFPKNKNVEIKIANDELRLLEANNKSVLKMVPKIIEEVSDLSAKKFSSTFRNAWKKSRDL